MSSKEFKSDVDGGSGWTYIDYDDIHLGDIIGGGGVGVIYKGHYQRKEVAIKTFFESRRVEEKVRKEFLDELMVMSKVKHSNIVELYGACVNPHMFFVMELCTCSLFQLLHVDKAKLNDKQNLQICIDVGCAMEYLHSLSPAIIHRDLKSHNVLQSHDNVYKLCDFGQVKVKNTTAGTPIYMAPELFLNQSYNKSVDVYAFGMLMWEIFNQEVPFYMQEVIDIRNKVIAGERPRLTSYAVNSNVKKLIQHCWSQTADERPSFSDAVDQLLELNEAAVESKHVDKMRGAGDALDSLLK